MLTRRWRGYAVRWLYTPAGRSRATTLHPHRRRKKKGQKTVAPLSMHSLRQQTDDIIEQRGESGRQRAANGMRGRMAEAGIRAWATAAAHTPCPHCIHRSCYRANNASRRARTCYTHTRKQRFRLPTPPPPHRPTPPCMTDSQRCANAALRLTGGA